MFFLTSAESTNNNDKVGQSANGALSEHDLLFRCKGRLLCQQKNRFHETLRALWWWHSLSVAYLGHKHGQWSFLKEKGGRESGQRKKQRRVFDCQPLIHTICNSDGLCLPTAPPYLDYARVPLCLWTTTILPPASVRCIKWTNFDYSLHRRMPTCSLFTCHHHFDITPQADRGLKNHL